LRGLSLPQKLKLYEAAFDLVFLPVMMDVKSRKKITFLDKNDMLDLMKKIVQFHISRAEEGGYVAESDDLHAVTQGETLDELMKNIREVAELALEGEDLERLGFVPNPSIAANFKFKIRIRSEV
jgi:predicted RNase H-like HicB family nuclease